MDAAPRLRAVPSSPRGLSFRVLGRLEAYYDGVELDIGPQKQRALLALLLLSANRVVSTERLIDDLWGDAPPSSARAALQVYVAGLRKTLTEGGASLRTRAPGYVLELDDGSLDLALFTELYTEAREYSAPEQRANLLHDALRLWRDDPLPELRAEPFAAAAVGQLEQLRLAALEERIDADLELGRDAELVPELESLVAEHPFRERLRAQLMLALYRSGRQADALEAYQTGRRVLQDDLGLEPGKELRDLEAAILRHDEALLPARSEPADEPEPEQPSSAARLSRRAVIVAGVGGFAAVAFGTGVAVLRSGGASGARVRPGSVGVVDPVERRVVAEIPLGFSSPMVAAGENAVWVVDPKGNTLTRIDPETNAAASPNGIPVQGVPLGLAAGEGSVWIAMNEERKLTLLEVGSELVDLRRRIVLERREAVLQVLLEPVKLAVGDGAVWALERGGGELNRINPSTHRGRLLADGLGASSSITVGRDAVWLGGPDGVKKLDLETGVEIASTPVEEVPVSRTTSIARGRDAVWFVGESSTKLWRIRPSSAGILGSVAIGPSPSAVTVAEDGAVWVASSTGTALSRYDPETEGVERVEVGTSSLGLASDFARVWTSPGAPAS
jgi:DNA-binding SARP family transcriptional activator/streptogramin lyase